MAIWNFSLVCKCWGKIGNWKNKWLRREIVKVSFPNITHENRKSRNVCRNSKFLSAVFNSVVIFAIFFTKSLSSTLLLKKMAIKKLMVIQESTELACRVKSGFEKNWISYTKVRWI